MAPDERRHLPRVAVFGISGFSGRHFERFVVSKGLVERFVFFGQARDFSKAEKTGAFTYMECDPRQDHEILRFIADVQPAYILNLIGILSAPTLEDFLAVHVAIPRSICEAVLASGLPIEKLLLIGSAAEYGGTATNPVREDASAEPISWYGLSKLYQTLLAGYFFRNHALPVVVARSFNILGEGLSPHLSIGSFMAQIDEQPNGGTIKVGDVSTSRDFLDIAEVSRRYWTLLMKGRPGDIYNVCSGEPRTVRSVLEDLIRRSSKRIEIEVDPVRLKARDLHSIYGDSSKFDQLER